MKSKYLLLILPLLVGCGNGDNSSTSNSNASSESTHSSSVNSSIIFNTTSSSSSSTSSSSSSNLSSSTSSSTSSSSSSSSVAQPIEFNLAEEISEYAKGIKVSSVVKAQMHGKDLVGYIVTTSKYKEFSFVQYEDESLQNRVLAEYYTTPVDDNYVYATRLNVNNEYTYAKLYNPATSEFYTWEDGYSNLFSSLSEDQFEKGEDNKYSLKLEAITANKDSISTLLYGNPGFDVQSFVIYSDAEYIRFSSVASFVSASATYEYTFESKVLAKGENTPMDYRTKAFDPVEDVKFEKMLNDLKANNYTAVVYNKSGVEEQTSYYYSNDDKIYYETEAFEEYYKVGYYQVDEYSVQEVENRDGSFYKVGSPMEGSLDEIHSSFKLNRACFDYENDTYTMKKGIDGDISAITILEAWASELDEFTIKEIEDGYEFKNITNELTTTVTFTNIGTTDVGFDIDSVLEPDVGTKWSEVLDEESYAYLVSAAGEDNADLIPVPEMYSEWIQFSEEEGGSILISPVSSTPDDDMFAYYLQLEEAGFMISEEVGENGGVMALMLIEKDGVEQILVVEFLYDEDFFYVLTYCVIE